MGKKRRLGKYASLEDRFWHYVDKTTYCWNWDGQIDKYGYGTIIKDKKKYKAHRLSYEYNIGPIPDGMLIDHKCFNHGCVNPTHLRFATRKQNGEHLEGLTKANTSGYRGAYWSKTWNKWVARVQHNGKAYHAGYFDNPADAGKAAQAKRDELFTHDDGKCK